MKNLFLIFILIFYTRISANTSVINLAGKSFVNIDTTNSKDSTQVDSVKASSESNDTTVIPAPEGITAGSVIKTYIDSIGGAESIRSVMDRVTIMHGKIQGVKTTIIIYQKVPNKLKQVIKAGRAEQRVFFNGKDGFMVFNDKKTIITGSELEKLKYESTIALLLDLKHYKIKLKLDGIAKVDSMDAYKVEMILPSGHVWIQYYNVKSGLKVKDSKYVTVPQGTFIENTFYSDYRNIGGIKYPFHIKEEVGAQKLDFHVSSIKVNTGLIDREFEYDGSQ